MQFCLQTLIFRLKKIHCGAELEQTFAIDVLFLQGGVA